MLENFNAKQEIVRISEWIHEWFSQNGPEAKAVIGISGGKDSTVAAALCVRALGADRVIGVLMPNVSQPDIEDARRVVQLLRISALEVNIGPAVHALYAAITSSMHGMVDEPISESNRINTPPRIRMTTLYAIAQTMPCGGRVCNTCNRSEDFIGYSTKYGDSAGDFAPLAQYTVTEIRAIGHELGLPADLIDKAPADGLCGKTDEDNIGFSYDVLDKYILTSKFDDSMLHIIVPGDCADVRVKQKIDQMHRANLHKLLPMPSCPRWC